MKRGPYQQYTYDKEDVIARYKAGSTAHEVAASLNIPYSVVYDVMRGTGFIRERGGIDVVNGTKICSVCRVILPIEHFDKGRTASKLRPECKSCRSKHVKETRIKYNALPLDEKQKILAKNRAVKLRHPEKLLHLYAKLRAKKTGVPFNIEISDVVIPEFCPILGIPLKFNEGSICASSTTLDRIINELGYIKGNVQVISWKANKIKSNGTLEELELIIHYLKTHSNAVLTQ